MEKRIYVFTFLILLFGFSFVLMTKEPKLLDRDERRYLSKKPQITTASIVDGKISDEFENYFMDQFPLRSNFRYIKNITNYKIFLKTEYNGIIMKNDIAVKLDFKFSYENISKTAEKLQKLKDDMLNRNKCYFALVPDKNCFFNIDYDRCINNIQNELNAEIIRLDDLLLTDYYKYDSHWNQKNIIKTANKIMSVMGHEIEEQYFTERIVDNFQGIYSSNAAFNKTEPLVYLTNNEIDLAIVLHHDTNEKSPIYNLDKLKDEKSLDMYDIFLSGAQPLLEITNNQNKNGKKLIIFRDSYGSSISPLFIHYYETIYLIDLRYITSNYINKLIKIDGNEDVLFLYSTTMMEIPDNYKIIN